MPVQNTKSRRPVTRPNPSGAARATTANKTATATTNAPKPTNPAVKREILLNRQERLARKADLKRREQRWTAGILAAVVVVLAIVIWQVIPHPSNSGSTTTRKYSLLSNFTAGAKGDIKAAATPVTLDGGLQYADIVVGTGQVVKDTDTITVKYTGWLTDGTQFDASANHGGTAQFPLNQVIQGWTKGIPGMKVGGERRLLIPGALAYGASPPDGSGIPPNATLIFDVTVVSIP